MIGNIAAGLYGTGVAPVTSSFDSIATSTVGSGGVSSITFTSGGAWADYKHLQLRVLSMAESGTPELCIQFNNDTNTNYSQHALYGTGSGSGGAYGVGSQGFIITWQGAGGSTTNPAANIIDILDFSNTSKYTTVRALTGRDNNGSGTVSLNSGVWLNTAAVSSIKFTTQNGSDIAELSHFALYGIKD
jgi:hypothetical protein